MEIKKERICCFIGHREINETAELTHHLYSIIESLILKMNVNIFLFGSKSRFNALAYEQISKLKNKYPHIKRVYARAEFPEISDDYTTYLLEYYENTYYSKSLLGAGKAVYIKRNQEMIDKSDFCIFYFENNYSPKKRKSGTKLSFDYAMRKNKDIILLP